MTQYDFGTIDPATTSGTTLAGELNNFRNALNSGHSGATRPAYVVAGMTWIDTSAAPLWYLKLYDGTDDIIVAKLDTTFNVVSIPHTRQETIKTAAYTLVANDAYFTLVNNASSAVVYTLPAVGVSKYEFYQIVNRAAFSLTIDPNGAELIEGVSTLVLEPGASINIWPNAGATAWRAILTRSDGYFLRATDTADQTKKIALDLTQLTTATTRTVAVPDRNMTLGITHSTPVVNPNTASVLFTGIPAGVKRIIAYMTVMTLSASGLPTVRFGASGTPQTTGYNTIVTGASGTSINTITTPDATGVSIVTGVAPGPFTGTVVLERAALNSNVWEYRINGIFNTVGNSWGVGTVTMTGEVDRLQFTTNAGTPLLNGTMNVSWEF